MSIVNRKYVIREALLSRDPSLHHRAEIFIDSAVALLPHAWSTFPSGTSHGPEHTHAVEYIGGLLLPEELLRELSDDELFYLLLGFHYHDLGMVGTEAQNVTEAGREQVRREHAVSIALRIGEKWQDLGFKDEGEAQTLGEICRGHRPKKNDDGRASWEGLSRVQIIEPGRAIRLRLLSALVYAIDELHLGADRAPQRVAEWKEIENEEARRHWFRHASVRGPHPLENCVAFQVKVATPSSEEDLRRNHLRKAFLAVNDLEDVLAEEGIGVPQRTITIEWNRAEAWRLLMIRSVSSDCLTRAEIIERTHAAYTEAVKEHTDLAGLCEERGNAKSDVVSGIERAIRDGIELGLLRADESVPERWSLSTDAQSAKRILDALRAADEIDTLVAGPYMADHEFHVFRGEYGRRYFDQVVSPAAKRTYGVDFCVEPNNSPLRTLVQRSPTACRLMSQITPHPSVLVKRDLLSVGVLLGFCTDALRDPEMMLDKLARSAVQDLAHQIAAEVPRFLSFLEELALVGGLTLDQVFGIMPASEDAPDELNEQPSVNITISQEQISGHPLHATGYPYFIAAGIRSGTPVKLICAEDAPLKVSVPDNVPGPRNVGAIGIERREDKVLTHRVDLRCGLEIDPAAKVVQVQGYPLDDPRGGQLPLIGRLPPPTRSGKGQFTFALRFPWLTAGDLDLFRAANRLLSTAQAQIHLVFGPSNRRIGIMEGASIEIPIPLDEEVLDALLEVDPKLPVPWFIDEDVVAAIRSSELEKRATEVRRAIEAVESGTKRDTTSFYLISEFANGKPYREEFLTFIPGSVFTPPTLKEEGAIGQEEFERRWQSRTENFALMCFICEGAEQLRGDLRAWAENWRSEFPVKIRSDLPAVHHCKTVFSLEFLPRIDRTWHSELPVLAKVRPSNPGEQRRIEVDYWKSICDLDRAELAEERLKRTEGGDDLEDR